MGRLLVYSMDERKDPMSGERLEMSILGSKNLHDSLTKTILIIAFGGLPG